MIALDDWESLKRKVEEMERDRARAEGSLAQLGKRLKEVLGVSSLKEARLALKKLEEEERVLARRWEKALAEVRKAVGTKLDAKESQEDS